MLYTAIDLDAELILDVDLFGTHGADLATSFLNRLSEAMFLVDGFDCQTSLTQLKLSGRRNYTDINLTETDL